MTRKASHEAIAQDWYQFDPDYWNPLPDTFTSHHLSLDALAAYTWRLEQINRSYGQETFERDGEPYIVILSEDAYQELQRKQASKNAQV